MRSNKYSLSSEEYFRLKLKGLLAGLKNITFEYFQPRIEIFIRDINQYSEEKAYYDSLSDDEKMKIEIEEFQKHLLNELRETSDLKYFLLHRKLVRDKSDNENDFDYDKTMYILADLSLKIQYFEKQLVEKIASMRFDPPLTEDLKKNLIHRMVIDEYRRLNNNLISYKYFLSFLSSFYGSNNNIKLNDFQNFKCTILMFLLDVDYDGNTPAFDNYQFPEIPISCIENHVKKDGSEDDFTLKAKNKMYAKIIRDAASHGEYYPEGDGVRIENSKGIPRISLRLGYSDLHKFVMDNLSDSVKNKYSFLLKIVEADKFEDVQTKENDSLNQMLVLMLNNLVQYNLEHHFNYTESEINEMDLTMFSVFDENDNNKRIDSNLPNKKILMDIKNAIGHDNVTFNEENILLRNNWTPTLARDHRQPINRRIECDIKDLLIFLLQYDLYRFSITSQLENSVLNRFNY